MLSVRFLTVRCNNQVKQFHNFQQFKNCSYTGTLIHRLKTINYNSQNVPSYVNNYINHAFRPFSSEQSVTPADPDVFGDLSGEKFQRIELDDDEKKVEKFEKNETSIPRRYKLSKGQYEELVKKHINARNLDAAMKVLDLIRRNRDKPTTYLYNMLMRAYARQGNLSITRKLYTIIRKRHYLQPNAATYTNMITACINSYNHTEALKALENLREEIEVKNVTLNETHYNAFIRAYGVHHRLVEAFQFADIMVDKRMSLKETTFSALMYAANSNKENGLRHVLVIWHRMQTWRIKPSLNTYNLILRAIRETQLGDFKINDLFNAREEKSRVTLNNDDVTSDLLAYPPVVSRLLIESLNDYDHGKLPVSTSPNKLIEKTGPENQPMVLQRILRKNPLALFGGYEGFLNRMIKDGISPDERTITMIMDLAPNSLDIEQKIIELARKLKLNLDIDFFNILIKKRSFRKDYTNARLVLDQIQSHHLTPNIMTWGVLALTCSTLEDAEALIQNMRITGHLLNAVIMGSLVGNASVTNDFDYIHEMMDKIIKYKIRPTKQLYLILDKFQQKITNIVTKRVNSKHSNNPRYATQLAKFNRKYGKIQEMNDRDIRTAC